MSGCINIYTDGGGPLLRSVFNAIAMLSKFDGEHGLMPAFLLGTGVFAYILAMSRAYFSGWSVLS